jgi:integrase/recombinase XerD
MARPRNIILLNETYRALAGQFYEYLLRLGYHPKTSRSRYNYTCEFLHWLEQRGELDIRGIDGPTIKQYYDYISSRPSLNPARGSGGGALSQKTTHSHLRNVRDLFEMLLSEGRIRSNPASTLYFPYPKGRAERAVLTQEEIQALYAACETAQERAILSLAYGCGLRAGELERCNIEDIRLREKLLVVPRGKGLKRRVVPMSAGVAKDLSDYYYNEREALTHGRDYPPHPDRNREAFMLHSRGGRMRKWTYNKYLKRIIEGTENEAIKKKQITIHNLRHSIATHLVEQGVAVEQVRQFLGHSQLETTQIYTHISRATLQKLMR